MIYYISKFPTMGGFRGSVGNFGDRSTTFYWVSDRPPGPPILATVYTQVESEPVSIPGRSPQAAADPGSGWACRGDAGNDTRTVVLACFDGVF